MSDQVNSITPANSDYGGGVVTPSTWFDYQDNNASMFGGLAFGYIDATTHIVEHLTKLLDSPDATSLEALKTNIQGFCQQRQEFIQFLKNHPNPIF